MAPIRNNIIEMSGRTASAQMLRDYVIDWLQRNFPEPGHKVITEHPFHPHRKWRFDVAVVPARVGIEFMGAEYVAGHHTRGPGYVDDARKVLAAGAHGWMVIPIPLTLLRNELPQTLADLEATILCRMDYIARAQR